MSLYEGSGTPPMSLLQPQKMSDDTPPVSPLLMTLSEEFMLMDNNEEMVTESLTLSSTASTTTEEHAKNVEPFSCDGGKKSNLEFYKDRLQKTNGTLLSLDNVVPPDMPQIIELFGFNFETDFSSLDLNKLFIFLKQWIGRFDLNIVDVENNNLQRLREDIVNFMEFIKVLINRLDKTRREDVQMFISSVMTYLHNSLIYMDQLSEVTYDKEYVVDKTASHKFHLCLDLYWNILEIFHIITSKFTDISYSHQMVQCTQMDISEQANSVFYKILKIILWELVLHSKNRFNKISLKEALNTPVYTCRCVKDVWSLIISIVHHRQIYNSEESFWIQIHYIIQTLQNEHHGQHSDEENMELDSDVYLYPNGQNIKGDNSNFCLWLLVNLAKIEVSEFRNNNQLKNVKSGNYFDVISVLKKCIHQGDVTETHLRYYMQCCLQLVYIWEPNIDLIVLFWDYYFKRLNTSFQISSSSIDGLATISKTAGSLLELCQRLCNKEYKEKHQDSSFQLYLALLCNHLHRLLDTDSVREWKQMKGRIYSKFHQRRMQELTETGLYNFTCLFICLAITADLEDVTSKLFDFYDMIQIKPHNTSKKLVLWKGMFASVLLYSQRKMDASFITEKLQSDFNEVTLKFASSIDSGEHHYQWKLINFYFESLQEVFESSSDLSSSEYKLIGGGISRVINNCRNHELQTTLSTLQVVISKFRAVFDNNRSGNFSSRNAMYSCIWMNIFLSIKELSSSLTASPQLADILADLCLAAKDCNREDFETLMKFATGETVNKSITCRFLSHVLPVEGVMTVFSTLLSDYQTALIQIWIRCSIFVPATSQQLLTLNRCMLQLDDVKSLFMRSGLDIPADGDKAALHFFKAIQITHSKLQVWKEKIQLRDKVLNYFKDIPSDVLPVIQTLKPVDTLKNIYTLVGYLVKCCSVLLFVQSKPDCPLPNIINSMIVPHNLFNPEKPVSPVFISVVKNTLHLFVRGLSNLDYRKAPYVQRRLKDIVTIYLPKYSSTSGLSFTGSTTSVHPLVVSLKESCVRQPSDDSMTFREFILDIVREKFLQSNMYMLPNNYQMAIAFINDLLNRTLNKSVMVRDTVCLLRCLLEVMLLTDVVSCQQMTQNIIKQLLESCDQNTQNSELSSIIEKFISCNQKLHLDGVMKTLQKCSTFGKQYIRDALPKLQHIVVEHESQRGVGVDNKLRQSLVMLMKSTGSMEGKSDTDDLS